MYMGADICSADVQRSCVRYYWAIALDHSTADRWIGIDRIRKIMLVVPHNA